MTNHTCNNAWKQKHRMKRWVEYAKNYKSIALHNIVWGYKTRGRWGRELKVDGVKLKSLNKIQWVTKRYNIWDGSKNII